MGRWVRKGRGERRLATTIVGVLTISLLLTGCTDRLDLDRELTVLPFGDAAAPDRLGDIRFVREPGAEEPFADAGPDALVADGRVYSVHRGDAIEASLQLAAFKPGALERRDDLVNEVLGSLGGRAEPTRFGPRQGYVFERTEQRLLVWFAPDLSYYQLLVARASFEQAHEVFAAVLAFQHGEPVEGLDAPRTERRHDPRRGTRG